jgi:hypothetical protein
MKLAGMINMKMKFFATSSLVVFQLAACITFAASVSTADPKKDLGITEGVYKVVASSTEGTDPFCASGSSYTVKWTGTDHEPVLSLGSAVFFSDLNRGLEADGEDEDGCKLKVSTQSEKSLIRTDTFSECAKSANDKTQSQILKVKGSELEYRNETKVSRKGKKVLVFSSSCTLSLKKK